MQLRLLLAMAATLAAATTLSACDWMKAKQAPPEKSREQLAKEQKERIRKACASDATYDRLKELVFDEAARIRNADARVLDPIAAGSVVRMEDPLVKSRDEALNVTVCTGRFILELPPGAENAFDGLRRVSADVEYAAQAAADGSGLVYQMDGAEPIIYRLAAVGLKGGALPQIAQRQAPPVPIPAIEKPPADLSPPAPAPAPPSVPKAAPAAKPPAPPAAKPEPEEPARVTVRPSFNCRYGRSRSEKLVCGSPRLAALDREMSSLYYSVMASADPGTRVHLRRTRDAFLVRRDRCATESCVSAAYLDRMAELRGIGSGG